MQESNLLPDDVWQVDERRVERFDFTASEIFEEAPQSDEVIRLSDDFEIFTVVVATVAVKFETIFTQGITGDVGRRDVVFIKDFLGDFEETFKVKAVVFDSFFTTTRLDFKVFKKILNEIRDIHNLIITQTTCRTCKRRE